MKISKHVIIVVVVAVVVVGAVASFMLFKPDAQKLIISAVEKQMGVDDIKTVYNLSYSMKTGGISLDANGMISIIKKSNATKVSLALDTFGESIRIDQYQTGDSMVQCMKSLLNTTCQKVSGDSMPLKTPQEQAESLKEFIDQKIIIVDYVGSKTIAGRNCDEVHAFYDPKKEDPLVDVSGNLDMNICLDREIGIPLEMLMSFDSGAGDGSGPIKVGMTLTDIAFGVDNIIIPEYTESTEVAGTLV